MRVLVSWSSGKDSAWMVHVLRGRPDAELVALLTTLNGANDRVAMHAVRRELLRAQAAALGLPLIEVDLPDPCRNEDYEAAMAGALDEARDRGVEVVAFGDLFLDDIRAYREEKMAGTGLAPIFPLWREPTAALARSMVDAGVQARVSCVDPRRLDASFAGRAYDHAFLDALPDGVDPCGENGEFHTFVHAGPMLASPIEVEVGDVVERGGFVYADVRPAGARAGG